MPKAQRLSSAKAVAVSRERDRSGHLVSEDLCTQSCLHLLEHSLQRQNKRNRKRIAESIPGSVAAVQAMKRRVKNTRRKAMMQRILFQFVLGSNIDGTPVGSSAVPVGTARTAHAAAMSENITSSYVVVITKGKQFQLQRLHDSVSKEHARSIQKSQKMKDPTKAKLLRFASSVVSETINSWLDTVDEDVISFNVEEVITSHCSRSLNVVTPNGNAGHVRITLDTITAADTTESIQAVECVEEVATV